MNIDDIEIGKKYVVNWYGDLIVCECVDVAPKSGGGWAGFVNPDGKHRSFSVGAVEDYVIRPDIPRRTIDEIAQMAEPEREAHQEAESHGGFECVWRVRCCGHGCNRYGGRYLAHDKYDLYTVVMTSRMEGAAHFPTQSDAIRAAEKAGWYVDAEKALCPECRDKMTTEEED